MSEKAGWRILIITLAPTPHKPRRQGLQSAVTYPANTVNPPAGIIKKNGPSFIAKNKPVCQDSTAQATVNFLLSHLAASM